MKPRLFISNSGGRTSGYMTALLRREFGGSHDIIVGFANTGLEHPETLRFVDRCDREMGFNSVWVEALVNIGSGNGTTHHVVTYETASRNGEPMEAMIQKYGIPNKAFPHCTRETKERPLTSYLRSVGWEAGTYDTAIGIRADEIDRMSPSADRRRFIYPLIKRGVTKRDVLSWWKRQPFDLMIPEHFGNCETCWKKSLRKLLTIAKERPQAFDFMRRMEREYAHAGAGTGPRVFFRENMSTDDLFTLAEKPFNRFLEDGQTWLMDILDVGAACGESCEIGADDDKTPAP